MSKESARSFRSGFHATPGLLVAFIVSAIISGCSEANPLTSLDYEAPAASVEVTPATVTIEMGETVQLTAMVRDVDGNVLMDRVVTWLSSEVSVATVNDNGLALGVGPGSATIMATREGKTGSALVTVTRGGDSPECENPSSDWIWCDDFEQDRLTAYFEYDRAGGDFARVAGVGINSSHGMRVHFSRNQVEAGSLHLAFGKTPDTYFKAVDAGIMKYREVYWRMYLMHESGWSGGGGDKLSRATIFARSDWSQAMIAHVWSGESSTGGSNEDRYHLLIDPASGTDEQGNLQTQGYNDFNNLRWLGLVESKTPIFDSAHNGHWYCVEAHVRLNDPGQANGVFELWIDGTLEAQKTGMNWIGSYQEFGINAVFFENYWNDGSPQNQERYFDNIVVSTQPIGCAASGSGP